MPVPLRFRDLLPKSCARHGALIALVGVFLLAMWLGSLTVAGAAIFGLLFVVFLPVGLSKAPVQPRPREQRVHGRVVFIRYVAETNTVRVGSELVGAREQVVLPAVPGFTAPANVRGHLVTRWIDDTETLVRFEPLEHVPYQMRERNVHVLEAH